MKRDTITKEEVVLVLSYNQNTGVFVWKCDLGKNHKAGKVAGGLDRLGYRSICISRVRRAAHRMAWLVVYGEWPKGEIDHINGIRDDNRIANLRDVDRSANILNAHGIRKNNSSGYHGCFKIKGYERWRAEILIKGKRHFLGSYPSPELAGAAYADAKARLVDSQVVQ